MTSPAPASRRALVTGASGHVGGRLVPELVGAGWTVGALARSADRLRDAPWVGDVEVAVGDVSDDRSLAAALEGVDVACYLVHSIGSGSELEDSDRAAAATFASACERAGVGRIVYLGGLIPEGEELSPHLRSRQEVGRDRPPPRRGGRFLAGGGDRRGRSAPLAGRDEGAGLARLDLGIEDSDQHGTRFHQRAVFAPRGPAARCVSPESRVALVACDAGLVTNYRVRLEGPADVVLRVATELADADGVELTSSEKPVSVDDGKVSLAITVDGEFDAVADAVAGIRGGLPSTASIALTDG